MRCKIEGCLHTKSVRMYKKTGSCWDRWQICPCCAMILNEMESINCPEIYSPTRCRLTIKKELKLDKILINTVGFDGIEQEFER